MTLRGTVVLGVVDHAQRLEMGVLGRRIGADADGPLALDLGEFDIRPKERMAEAKGSAVPRSGNNRYVMDEASNSKTPKVGLALSPG